MIVLETSLFDEGPQDRLRIADLLSLQPIMHEI